MENKDCKLNADGICHHIDAPKLGESDCIGVTARDAKPSLRLQIAWSQNPGIPHVVTEDIIIMRKP